MKKTIISVLTVLIGILAILWIYNNKDVTNQIIISAEDIYDKFTKEQIKEYTSDIQINSLQITNNDVYYNMLNSNQQKIYLALISAIKDLNQTAKLKDYDYVDEVTTMEDIKMVMQNLFLDHPEIFYVDSNYTVSTINVINGKRVEINLSYIVKDKADLQSKIYDIQTIIDPLINEARTKDTFSAELFLHDAVANMASYYKYENISDVPDECHTIYGCVVNKKSVCDGFAKTLQILLNGIGIENILVTGYLQNEAHAWNLVKLEDEWYNVDVTSNKSITNSRNNEELVVHTYFNISNDKIQSTNTIDNIDKLPNASGKKYNYYTYLNKYISKTDNFSYKLRNILDNNKNSDLIEFEVEENISSVPSKMVSVLQDNKYKEYVDLDNNKFNYYKILNTYIILKK